jgi:hypothetical protein
VLDNDTADSSIKKGILLHWLGYTGIADSYFTKAGLSAFDIDTIKRIRTIKHISFLRRFIKNICPPVLYRLIERMK